MDYFLSIITTSWTLSLIRAYFYCESSCNGNSKCIWAHSFTCLLKCKLKIIQLNRDCLRIKSHKLFHVLLVPKRNADRMNVWRCIRGGESIAEGKMSTKETRQNMLQNFPSQLLSLSKHFPNLVPNHVRTYELTATCWVYMRANHLWFTLQNVVMITCIIPPTCCYFSSLLIFQLTTTCRVRILHLQSVFNQNLCTF